MKITELHIENIKKIRAVEIRPRENEPVVLTGDNGQGKSSVLDAIYFALLNKGLSDPVRHGASKGTVRLRLSDGSDVEWIVEREVRNGKAPKLVVSDPRGLKMPSPQGFLSALVGSGLARDPLEFARLNGRDQAAALRESLGIDYSKLDADRRRAYDDRREANAEVKRLSAVLADMAPPEPGADPPAQERSASELFGQRQELEASLQEVASARQAADQADQSVADLKGEVADLRRRLEAAEAELADAVEVAATLRGEAESVAASAPNDDALAEIDKQLAELDNYNAKVRAARRYRQIEADLESATETANAHNDRINEIDAEKAKTMREARMPVDGMTVDDEGVRVSGAPFAQLSTAEQIRISATVAMAQDPAIKVLVVREGALVNRANLRAIAEQAAERGFQLWVERFTEQPDDTGIHIVDGGIAFLDGEPVDEPDAGEDRAEVTGQAEMALDDDTDEQMDPEVGARG